MATSELRCDLIGVDALHGAALSAGRGARTRSGSAWPGGPRRYAEAVRIGNEVETLYTNGPAGGGGAWKSAREVVAVQSVLVPAALARPRVDFVDA